MAVGDKLTFMMRVAIIQVISSMKVSMVFRVDVPISQVSMVVIMSVIV